MEKRHFYKSTRYMTIDSVDRLIIDNSDNQTA